MTRSCGDSRAFDRRGLRWETITKTRRRDCAMACWCIKEHFKVSIGIILQYYTWCLTFTDGDYFESIK